MKNSCILLFMAILSSCGLEVVGYLDSPVMPSVSDGQPEDRNGRLIWSIPSSFFSSNLGVEGFDIYYKVKKISDGANLTTDDIGLHSIESPPSVNKLKTQLMYNLISNVDIQRSPSIKIEDLSKGYKFVLDFRNFISALPDDRKEQLPSINVFDLTQDVESDPPLNTIPFYRSVKNSGDNNFKSFGNLFDVSLIGQSPVEVNFTTDNILSDNGGELEILFYIVAVGFDTATFDSLESVPVPIGTIKNLRIRL